MSDDMQIYRYTGPDSGITLQDKGTSTDVLLRPGEQVQLPSGHAAVRTLVARGYLVATDQPAAAQAPQEPAQAPAKKAATKPNQE